MDNLYWLSTTMKVVVIIMYGVVLVSFAWYMDIKSERKAKKA